MSIRIPIISEFDGTGIDRAAKQFANLETTGEKVGFALKKAFLPATAALAGLTAAAVPAIKAASDLNETISKSNVIFGDAAKTVQEFAGNAAKSLGQSKQQALDAASTFAVFGKAAGLAGNDLATFSTDFVTLASDLASFNNTSPEQAIQAIGAALRGESEPLRQYGVLLNDASLKQAAFELGIYDGSDALTAQQKVLAAQKLIFEQTGDAQGDFARTSEGLANQTKILTAELENAKTQIGEQLLPVVLEFMPYLINMATWVGENTQLAVVLASAIGGVSSAIVLANLGLKAYNTTAAITRGANTVLATSFNGVQLSIGGMTTALGLVGLTLTEFYGLMKDDSAWFAFKQAAGNAFAIINNVFMAVANQIRNAVTVVANGTIQMANVAIDALNRLVPGNPIPKFDEYEYAAWNEGFRSFDFSQFVSGTPAPFGDNRGAYPGNTQSMFPPPRTTPSITPPPPPPPPPGGTGAARSIAGIASPAIQSVLPDYFMAEYMAGTASEINVNITGGLATAPEIGEAVVNAIRSFNTVHGPANIAVG